VSNSQIVLLALIASYALYVLRIRSAATDRIAYLALALAGGVLVANPEWTNRAATVLGIGRGADLMFYFFILFSLFHFVTTASTIRGLRRDVGTLTREMALLTAKQPGSGDTAAGS
jgi:hypothetical protein